LHSALSFFFLSPQLVTDPFPSHPSLRIQHSQVPSISHRNSWAFLSLGSPCLPLQLGNLIQRTISRTAISMTCDLNPTSFSTNCESFSFFFPFTSSALGNFSLPFLLLNVLSFSEWHLPKVPRFHSLLFRPLLFHAVPVISRPRTQFVPLPTPRLDDG